MSRYRRSNVVIWLCILAFLILETVVVAYKVVAR